jgi:hypothetical protein
MLFGNIVTWFPLEKAQCIAAENSRHDPVWKYVVVPNPNKPYLAKVAVFDEDGVEVGIL